MMLASPCPTFCDVSRAKQSPFEDMTYMKLRDLRLIESIIDLVLGFWGVDGLEDDQWQNASG